MNSRNSLQAFLFLLTSSSLAACNVNRVLAPQSDLVTINPNSVASEAEIDDKFKDAIAKIGKYSIDRPSRRGECPVHIVAVPKSVSVDYKVATNVKLEGSGSGNIPTPVVILTPNVGGSYERIATTDRKKTISFDPSQLTLHRTTVGIQGDTQAVPVPPGDDGLRLALEQVILGYVNASHKLPCGKPGDEVFSVTFTGTKTGTGGLTLNFVVAKIGGDVASSNSTTQTAEFTYAFGGSEFDDPHI